MLRIQGVGMQITVGDVPGFHKAIMFTTGAFDPASGNPPEASITIPFDEEGWKAFQALIAGAGAGSRIIPVGAEALSRMPVPPPQPKMAVPRSR